MKIVIDIPEDKYLSLKKCLENDIPLGITDIAILNGTPLPKGRNKDLITKEQVIELVEFYQLNPQHFNFVDFIDEIKCEKPIIEAVEE